METESSNPVVTHPYGRACLNCSKAKCKCVSRSPGEGCIRCHRLNKPCLPGDSARKRKAEKNNPVTQIAQLQEKLDGLVSLLGAAPVLNPPQTEPEPKSPPVSNPFPRIPSAATAATPAPAFSPHFPALEPSPDDADECVRIFRNEMLKYFPFIHLPADVQCLRQERPFLLLCIVTIATSAKSTQRRRELGKEVKQILAQRIILENRGAINIDLLLGLLTFITWGHDQLLNGNPSILSRYTQMAMALVFELGLNKPPPAETNMLPVDSSTGQHGTLSGAAGSLEARRAVLGCFVMSSIISLYFGQIDAMQWTPYMDECLKLLLENKECPSDESFAQQVRLHLILREFENTKVATVPSAFYLKAFKSKLDQVKTSLSAQLQQDEILLATMYHVELGITELVISNDTSGFLRVEYLCKCLGTVKSALDNFFRIPPTDYHGISFPFFTQLARYIIVLYKLSTLNDPAWDTTLVRSDVDLLQVLDQVISNFQKADVTDTSTDSVLARTVKIFTSVRSWYGARLVELTRGDGHAGYQAVGDGSNLLGPFSLDGLNDLWLKDIFTYGPLEGDSFF